MSSFSPFVREKRARTGFCFITALSFRCSVQRAAACNLIICPGLPVHAPKRALKAVGWTHRTSPKLQTEEERRKNALLLAIITTQHGCSYVKRKQRKSSSRRRRPRLGERLQVGLHRGSLPTRPLSRQARVCLGTVETLAIISSTVNQGPSSLHGSNRLGRNENHATHTHTHAHKHARVQKDENKEKSVISVRHFGCCAGSFRGEIVHTRACVRACKWSGAQCCSGALALPIPHT